MIKTRRLKINPERPEPEKISQVVEVINRGGIAAFPTETVYGLAGLANRPKVLRRIRRLKRRPAKKELTIQVSSVEAVCSSVDALISSME